MSAKSLYSKRIAFWTLPLAVMGYSGCDAETNAPFRTQVVPVLERRCANSACHGVTDAQAAASQLDPSKWLTFRIDAGGKISDLAAAEKSAKSKVNSRENGAFSSLLRKTLPVAQGGQYHYKNQVFESRTHPDYQVLATWVTGVRDGTEATDQPPLDARESLFRDKIYPTLLQKGCATATCHGSLTFGGAVFEPPVLPGSNQVSRADLRKTLAEVRHNVTLWGDPLHSRLIAKMLPLAAGGIPHKGGNDLFFASEVEAGTDPRKAPLITSILAWIEATRAAENAALPSTDPPLVAVGGPLAAADVFAVQPFVPGTDLYRIDAPYTGGPVNLTAAIHSKPADIRSPAVSHDGKTLVFAMRTAQDTAHNIYTMGMDGNNLKQLTFDKAAAPLGRAVANLNPVFGPHGGVGTNLQANGERIYWSSHRGDLSDAFDTQNADLYAINPDGNDREQLTWTVVPELAPWFLSTGEFYGTVAYTLRRSAEGGYKGVFFRFPIDHNREYHIQPEAHPHFGMSEPQQVFYRLRELPDGRSACVLLDQGNVWRGGQLALLERQFAVELAVGQESQATLPGFRHALTNLTPNATRNGMSLDGLWRDPTPLTDGSLVAAHAVTPTDLDNPLSPPRPSLVRITLKSDPATNRPEVDQVTVLQDDPNMAWSEPVAAVARAPEDPPHPRQWDSEGATATLVHSGVQVIEALLAQLAPLAPRIIRKDLAFVRAVVPLSAIAELSPQPVPAAETRYQLHGATTLALTGRMPLFAAAEVEPASDGSLAAHIAAKVPVRLVTLDHDRVAVGALQHQWYAAAPGERFPVGIPETSFAARCAGCHGAMDGKPASVMQPPVDFVTQASVTAALYQGQDRRRPLPLPTVGSALFQFVDFRRDVQPILDAKCASCHSGATPSGDLSLGNQATQHYNDAYENLLRPGQGSANGFAYVDALGYRGRDSYLAEKVMGKEYEATRALTTQCPPPGSPQLTPSEKATLVRWMELGAAWIGVPPSGN